MRKINKKDYSKYVPCLTPKVGLVVKHFIWGTGVVVKVINSDEVIIRIESGELGRCNIASLWLYNT